MTTSRKLVAAAAFTAALLGAWTAGWAQKAEPKSNAQHPRPTIVQGESERGVTMAIKSAVDKIAAPSGNAAKYFRVVAITGQKTAKSQKVIVDLEVRDAPFPATSERDSN